MSSLTIIIAQRLWQAGGGLVTAVMITKLLTPEVQGWYYSFLSIAATHTLFDLGLSVVLTQFSAHSTAKKRTSDTRLQSSEADYFHALVYRSVRNYLFLGSLFFVTILIAGLIFFNHATNQPHEWKWAWVTLIVSIAINLSTLPFLAIVEGQGSISETYSVRLAQNCLGSLLCWTLLFSGAGLWATVATPFMTAIIQPIWLVSRHKDLLRMALRKATRRLTWFAEIWPLQWRVGASWLSGYLLTQIYTPLLFATKGASEAGQMGLSITIANMLALIAFSGVARSVPNMAHAAATNDWKEMDQLFYKGILLSASFYIIGATTGLLALKAPILHPFAERILPLPICALLFIAIFANQLCGALSAHLRSYRQEPLVWLNITASILTIVGSLIFVKGYGSTGIVITLLIVQVCFALPVSTTLWRGFHRKWRAL